MDELNPKLAELRDRLKAAYIANKLDLNATTIGAQRSDAIITLFTTVLGQNHLTLQGPVNFIDAGELLTVTGTALAPLYNVPAMNVECQFGVTPEFPPGIWSYTLTALFRVPGGWNFPTSFPMLAGTYFALLNITTPMFILSTTSHDDAALGVRIEAGPGMFARLNGLSGPLAPAATLIGQAPYPPSPCYGPIIRTETTFDLHMAARFPAVTLAIPGMMPITIAQPQLVLYGIRRDGDEATGAWIAVQGNGMLAGTMLPLAIQVPSDSDTWGISLPGTTTAPIPGIASFLGFYPPVDLPSLLPPSLDPRTLFTLSDFSVGFTPDPLAFQRFNFTITATGKEGGGEALWTIIPSLLWLDQLQFQVSLLLVRNNGTINYRTAGTISGRLTIAENLEILATVILPVSTERLQVLCTGNVPLSLSALARFVGNVDMARLLPDGLAALGTFELQSLQFLVNPSALTVDYFGFTVGLAEKTWDIIPGRLALAALTVEILIDKPLGNREISGAIQSTLLINEEPVDVVVQRLPGQKDWTLQVKSDQIHLGSINNLQPLVNQSLIGFLPARLADAEFYLYDLAVDINLSQKEIRQIGFRLESLLSWEIIPGILTVRSAGVAAELSWNNGPLLTAFRIYGEMEIVGAIIHIAAQRSRSGSWTFTGALADGETINLMALVNQLLKLPPALQINVPVEGLTVTATPDTGLFSIAGRTAGFWELPLIPGVLTLRMKGSVAFKKYKENNVEKTEGTITGIFLFNSLELAITYQFSETSSTLVCAMTFRGIRLSASLVRGTKDGKNYAYLKFQPGDLKLGEILEFLADLAAPGLDFTLGSPWDLLNQINFKDFTITIDLITNALTIEYAIKVDLWFVTIDTITLTYGKTNGRTGVTIAIQGQFLGKHYGSDEPLVWDLINDEPPAVPAEGPEFLDLRYLGIGQHISFSDTSTLKSVGDVIEAMKNEMKPVQDTMSNPLATTNNAVMRFDRQSHLLFGMDFTLLRTITLGVVLNDPYFYGMVLSLKGERSGSLAGLRFELLYKRITDDIGVFKVELRVPDAFRQLEFGAVCITLPVLKLEIYTNGNFRLDLGFPHNGNTADSFCIQMFPFIGRGGLYLAVLNGATSERVPRITNGSFDPVVEFGLGVNIGLGKEFRMGPISGGLCVTLEAILEGVLGWFTPTSGSGGKAMYYWIQGTVAIAGKLYGDIDFKIIRIGISVEARASATLVIQAYEPIEVMLALMVQAKASIRILFITINFSFALHIEQRFTIAQRGTPPWRLDPAAPPINKSALPALAAIPHDAQPQLAMQRNHYRRRAAASWMRQRLFSTQAIADRAAGNHAATDGLNWSPVAVFDSIQEIVAVIAPAFSVAVPSLSGMGAGSDPVYQIVLTMAVDNSTDPAARTLDEVAVPNVDWSVRASDPTTSGFSLLMRGMLAWCIHALLGRHTGDILAGDLQQLYRDLETAETELNGFTYENLSGFFALNYTMLVTATPDDPSGGTAVGSTIFPIIPDLAYTTADQPAPLSFKSYNIIPDGYEALVHAYYDQLMVDYDINRTPDPGAPGTGPEQSCDSDGGDSVATLIFRDYFLMLAKTAVQTGIDLLDNYSYTTSNGSTLHTIAQAFAAHAFPYKAIAGDTILSICDHFGMTAERFSELNQGPIPNPIPAGFPLVVEIAVTPETIARTNQDVPIAQPQQITLAGTLYQIQEQDTFAQIAARFGSDGLALVADAVNANNPLLLNTGSHITLAQQSQNYTAFIYNSVQGDTLERIAAAIYIRNEPRFNGRIDTPELIWYEQTIANLNPDMAASFTGELPSGTTLKVPADNQHSDPVPAPLYITRPGDTLRYVAATLMMIQTSAEALIPLSESIRAANPGIDWNNLAPDTPVRIPQQPHTVQPGETIVSIASRFGLQPADLAGGDTLNSPDLPAPLAVLHIPQARYSTVADDTLALVASRFNLSIEHIAADVADVPNIFPAGTKLQITGIPKIDIETLIAQTVLQGGANRASAMVSRFLLHGLRLPDPNDAGFLSCSCDQLRGNEPTPTQLHALYRITGQQFAAPDPSTLPYAITISKDPAATWIEFVQSTIVHAHDTPASLRQQYPLIDMYNPTFALDADLAPGQHLLTERDDDLVLTITSDTYSQNIPAKIFDPEILLNPRALPLFNYQPRRYTLQQSIHWQTPVLPDFGPASGTAPQAGEPTIWMLPGELLSRISREGLPPLPSALFTASDSNTPDRQPPAVRRYAWGTMVEIRLRQIIPASSNGLALLNSYELLGADQNNRETLRRLWSYMRGDGATDPCTISLLYAPSADSNNSRGLTSQPVVPEETFVIRTNLSTMSTSGIGNSPGDDVETNSATLADPAGLLRLIWEGSVTGTGGYTLNYSSARDGAGLPPEMFTDGNKGALQILVLFDSQKALQDGSDLRDFNNCAVVGDNIDPATTNLYAAIVELEAAAQEAIKVASAPPGTIGFELARLNPDYNPSATTAEQRSQALYSLNGYQVQGSGGFTPSNEGLPAGPAEPRGAAAEELARLHPGIPPEQIWYYNRIFPIAPFAASSGLPEGTVLPQPDADPYAGIRAGAQARVGVTINDIYGNGINTTGFPAEIDIAVGYTDDVIGFAAWPGLTSSYSITPLPDEGGPLLSIMASLRPGTYLPSPGNSFDQAMLSIGSHLERYKKIYYQIWQPDVMLWVTSTLDQRDTTPHRYPADRISLANFASAAYITLSTLLLQKQATITIGAGATFESIAEGRYASQDDIDSFIGALGTDNRSLPTDALFAAPAQIIVPELHVVAYGETLAAIAGAPEAVPQLARNNAQVPLNAGIEISAPIRITRPTTIDDSFAVLAGEMSCTVAALAQANADRTDILLPGAAFTAGGQTLIVQGVPPFTDSLMMLAERFRNDKGIIISPGELAAENRALKPAFIKGSTLNADRYIIQPHDTFARLELEHPQFPIDQLAQKAATSPNIIASGTTVLQGYRTPHTPSQHETLGTIAETENLGADQLALQNRATPLKQGATLFLPGIMTIDATEAGAYAPYSSPGTISLAAIAARFGEASTYTLAERNQTIRYIFVAGTIITVTTSQTVSSTTTTADDSLNTVLARLRDNDSSITLADLVSAIQDSTSIIRQGALMICRLPSTGSLMSLDDLSGAFNVSVEQLALANGSLQGLLRNTATVQAGGHTLIVGTDDTFGTLVERFRREVNVATSIPELASLNKDSGNLLNSNHPILIPPAEMQLHVEFGASYPSDPNYPGTIFKVETQVIIQRAGDCIAPDFIADAPQVAESVSMVAPHATLNDRDALSLAGFAEDFESAFTTLKVATGKSQTNADGNDPARDLWAVDFGPGGITSVDVSGTSPAFFGLRPLTTTLIDRKNVPIKTFNPGTGTLQPDIPPGLDMQGIDMEVWARGFLDAMELFLSPEYAVPAYRRNGSDFARIVQAKKDLAERISQGISSILTNDPAYASRADAAERMRQELLIDLSKAYATDAIIQYPASVASPFTTNAGYTAKNAPRLSGKPLCQIYTTGERDSLAEIATAFGISATGVALTLADITRILRTNATVTLAGVPDPATHTITAEDTITSVMAALAAESYQFFADHLVAADGLFEPLTTINIYGASRVLAEMVPDGTQITIGMMTGYFNSPLEQIVACIQEKTGIFVHGSVLSIDGREVTVDADNDTLLGITKELIAKGAALSGPTDLAQKLDKQIAQGTLIGAIDGTFVATIIRLVPEHNLSTATTTLLNGDSTVTILCNLKSPGDRRKLLLDLDYVINELEYDIRTVPGTEGYQSSSWLAFVLPISRTGSTPRTVQTDLGQVEIPIPLRGYPPRPYLMEQTGGASYTATGMTVEQAMLWNYSFSYEYQQAAQDTIYLRTTFNKASEQSTWLDIPSGFFDSLAQFAYAYPAIASELERLLTSSDTGDQVLNNTIGTFADIVESVATSWSYQQENVVTNAAPTEQAYNYRAAWTVFDGGTTEEAVLGSMRLTLMPDEQGVRPPQASPTGEFPTVEWLDPADGWRPLTQTERSASECLYEYAPFLPPAFQPIRHRLGFNRMNLMTTRNALAGSYVRRNEDLIRTRTTAQWFLYTTAVFNFSSTLQPLIEHDQRIELAPANLHDALKALFNAFADAAAGAPFMTDVAIQFGYTLVPGTDPDDAIISHIPVLFQPMAPYATDLPDTLYDAIQHWQSTTQFPPGTGLYIVELRIYSPMEGAIRVPMLYLRQLVHRA